MPTAPARRRVLMSPREIERVIARMAHQIGEPEDAQTGLILIGIWRGGEALARRRSSKIAEIRGGPPDLGFIAKAKPEVVGAERTKLAGYERDLERVRAALAEVPPPQDLANRSSCALSSRSAVGRQRA